MRIKFVLFALAFSSAAAAQSPASRTSIPVDRVVAVVGTMPVLWSEVMAAVNQARASGLDVPSDTAAQLGIARNILNELIDEEILVQKARELKIEISDAEVVSSVDRQTQSVRGQFKTEEEFRTELQKAGFGTPEEYRKKLTDQYRRRLLQQRVYGDLQKVARPRGVSEAEIDSAFEKTRAELVLRPGTVTFRQIVIAPKASDSAKKSARVKAEALLAEVRKGGDFEQIAKRESMDPGSKPVGGDLGWNRRGATVPEFERMMFALNPGQTSPVFETSFGFHILRVDRVQTGEVKARHILIAPVVDSADIVRARVEAASVAAQWRKGAAFDSLAARHHDPAEERGILQPFVRDSLPPSYATALAGRKVGDITEPFDLVGARGAAKSAIIQIVTLTEVGEYDRREIREQIRLQLVGERTTRDLLDDLRRKTYVAIKL